LRQPENKRSLWGHFFIRFLTDQEHDTETGLYNYNARLYDPVIGQFISADSIIPQKFNPQSLNRYSYCLNNPLIYNDPNGHSPAAIKFWSASANNKLDIGIQGIQGYVVSIERNANGLHDAVNFDGFMVGASKGGRFSLSQLGKAQIFDDGYKTSDVTRIEGLANMMSLSSSVFKKGGISIGLTQLGEFSSLPEGFIDIEGLELSIEVYGGYVWMTGEVYEVDDIDHVLDIPSRDCINDASGRDGIDTDKDGTFSNGKGSGGGFDGRPELGL